MLKPRFLSNKNNNTRATRDHFPVLPLWQKIWGGADKLLTNLYEQL